MTPGSLLRSTPRKFSASSFNLPNWPSTPVASADSPHSSSSSFSDSSSVFLSDFSALSSDLSCPKLSSEQLENFLRIIDLQWKRAERELMRSDEMFAILPCNMKDCDYDADKIADAAECIKVIDRFLVRHQYKEALSLLRGCRKFFSKSNIPFIIDLFFGMSEIETLKDIYIVNRREKHLGNVEIVLSGEHF